jgi:hypothetical protein
MCQPPAGKFPVGHVDTATVIEGGMNQGLRLARVYGAENGFPFLMSLPMMVLRCLEALDSDEPFKTIYESKFMSHQQLLGVSG